MPTWATSTPPPEAVANWLNTTTRSGSERPPTIQSSEVAARRP